MHRTGDWKRIVSAILTVALMNSILSPTMAVKAKSSEYQDTVADTIQVEQEEVGEQTEAAQAPAEPEIAPTQEQAPSTEEQTPPSEEQTPSTEPVPTQTETPTDDTVAPETAAAAQIPNDVYRDGCVQIYNHKQLTAIGSAAVVYTGDKNEETFGTGEVVIDENGAQVRYSPAGTYRLMNDIVLNADAIWTLPQNFTGRFINEGQAGNDALYDSATDTIYVYHNYQLLTIAGENSEQEPVMSNDRTPSEFGMGQFMYANGTPADESQQAAQEYLTYAKTHRYVLSKNFSEQMPELLASVAVSDTYPLEGEHPDGRTYPGQVVYTDEATGKDYILIGNEVQLRAIGSNKSVNPRLYIYKMPGLLTGILGADPKYIPYYPGDADIGLTAMPENGATTHGLVTKQPDEVVQKNGYVYTKDKPEGIYKLADKDLSNPNLLEGILGVVGGLLGGLTAGNASICGVDQNGLPDHNIGQVAVRNQVKDLRYSSDANYIIFRNIDLSSTGENSNEQDDNWVPIHLSGRMEGRVGMVNGNVPTISNVTVHQTGKLDPSTTRGLGFFGSISNRIDEKEFGHSQGTTLVKDIHLSNVSVQNESTQVKPVDPSLVKLLLGTVGVVLGGLLGIVEGLLDFLLPGLGGLKLGDIVEGLLTVQAARPDAFAVGSFAGRIVGDVKLENCTVENASVSSVKDMTGGFVGYTEGAEKYDGLSNLLGGSITALSKLLNLIPGIGLGDLITVLLEKDISLGKLIPIGYYKPTMDNCSVQLQNQKIGSLETSYNGGFVGMQTAANVHNCRVSNLQSVQANIGAGGFAGIARDAVIRSLLSDLGVDLITFDVKAKQEDCVVETDGLTVTAATLYAGGFNGVMTNSLSTRCSVTGLSSVSAQNYAGGFTGRATIGFGTTIGDGDEKNNTLLQSVSKLLTQLVAPGNEDKLNTLLALSGLTPSEVHECTVDGTNWSVEATDRYAGGLMGQGDGTRVSPVNTQADQIGGPTVVKGLASVSAKSYAGGIAGSVVTANPIGVLNNTLGVGSYLPFQVEQVNLEGSSLKVTAAEEYAAGGLGLMLGGKVQQVKITGLESVAAQNYAGGLAGRAGSGNLVRQEGLDLLGLGLIKVDNVLSLAQGLNIKINNTQVQGIEQGAVISAIGVSGAPSKTEVLAGGLISEAEGIQITDTEVSNIKEVSAQKGSGETSYAGGFVGKSHTGGLAGIAQKDNGGKLTLPGIVDISNLVNLVPYLLPEYTNCKTAFVTNGEKPQVMADYAGGFFGHMNSGKVDNSTAAVEGQDYYAVIGLENVQGSDYAGGFAGRIEAGAVAASDGLKLLGGILNLDIDNLLSVVKVYIPVIKRASVQSAGAGKDGFVVEATAAGSSAGGFAGQAGGATITDSNVFSLKHTKVTAPSDLEAADAASYYGADSAYAVKAGRYAGGFVGRADIDSAAQVGGGLKVGNLLDLKNLLSALDVVATKITNCNVHGSIGGFSVLANGAETTTTASGTKIGKAGGFIGEGSGSQISNSNVYNFAYIIGQEMAGGYAGHLEPGNVAAVLGGDQDLLNGLLNINESLASLVKAFIPVVTDSSTTAIPCGGVVRADGFTDVDRTRGLAGGYLGYNEGARIDGSGSECAVVRLRSVYGGEAAGGFTGLMENANLAGTGNLKLLFGLVTVQNVLGLLQAVYPTETNTAVYGPLRQMDVETWNAWADAVASKGVYGYQFPADKVETPETLDQMIRKYAYGYNVKAGRDSVGSTAYQMGDAGGYVGKMEGGIITQAHAWDAKDVTAYKSAGGFAGEMMTGGVAEIGGLSLANGQIPILGSLGVLQTFVPVVRNSDVTGYQSGLEVTATGNPKQEPNVEKVGYAGGFVGHMLGGQIWGNWNQDGKTETYSATDALDDPQNNRCFVANLRRVNGTNAVGGFGGLVEPGSAAAVDTASKEGLLGGLLQHLISTPGNLAEVLNATMSTIEAADVRPWDDYGIVVDGVYSEGATTKYANAVGGFVGELQGTVIGKADNQLQGAHAEKIRSVTGGKHVGGFFGYADVSSVAELSASSSGEQTSILGSLVGLGSVKALDAFRTFIYDSSVTGTTDAGLTVEAKEVQKHGYVNDPTFTGNAGGFGGTLRNSSVKSCTVENLHHVQGKNYVGGFIGHMDKGGVVDAENVSLLDKFLGVGGDVLAAFGAHVDDSKVIGLPDGFTVSSQNTDKEKKEIVGGFAGYADIARMSGNSVTNLREVSSGQTAGGFVGQTSFTYLAQIKADSPLVKSIVKLLNDLLKQLWVKDIQAGGGIQINLGIIKVDVISKGNLLHVNLFGLDIGIELVKDQGLTKIHIGDSVIEVNCADDGSIQNPEDTHLKDEITISLIKANRTKIDGCSVTGVESGYNIYGGGAGNESDGSDQLGYAGGFVGFNNEGLLKNNTMDLADVIKGTAGYVGPFVGRTSLKTYNTAINDTQKIEGENNVYYVYRLTNPAGVEEDHLDAIYNGSQKLNTTHEDCLIENKKCDKYQIQHRLPKELVESDKESLHQVVWEAADLIRSDDQLIRVPAKVYVSAAQANLMLGRDTQEVSHYAGQAPGEMQDPCVTGAAIAIKKIWIDNDNKAGIRPDTIDVQLTKDQETVEDIEMNSSMMEPDTSIWSTTAKVAANDEQGNRIDYDITEAPIPGYVTIYRKSADGYTFYIINYLISELLQKDTVVIDYGLAVDIDVLTNDTLINGENETAVKGKLSGVTIQRPETGTAAQSAGLEANGQYGIAKVQDLAGGIVRYTPNTMKMDSLERLYYEVQVDGNPIKNGQKYVYGEVTVIPATEIYYEDNFSAIQYTDGKLKDGTAVQWETTSDNTPEAEVQDTDRPSKDRLLADWDDWYGNDSHYVDDAGYSNGTSHKVTITQQINKKGAVKPKAEFTFTGTGFDVISLTSGASGMLQMRIYDSDNKLVAAENTNTYYGYNRVNGEWVVDPDADETNALYQVPVLRKTGLPYGAYRVELMPSFIKALDEAGKETYDVFIDAIRIYDPADLTGKDYQEVENVYNQDGENHPKFMEIRQILLNANKISELDQNGAVFVDGKGNVTDMKEYESYGPKHEVYLAPGQAISFTLWANEIPDCVRVSGKLVMGGEVDMTVAAGVKKDSAQLGWESFRKATYHLTSVHDMFYDFTEQCIWEEVQTPNGDLKYKTRYPVVIMNALPQSQEAKANLENILSLTNLKWTGSKGTEQIEGPSARSQEQPEAHSIEMLATVSQENVLAAYALLNEKPERTITIQYQTLGGQLLGEEKVLYQEEGSSYDVSKWLDENIAGYTKLEVSGDAAQGTLDQDKVIQVVYGRDYALTISYQDHSGKEIADQLQEKIVEGASYDVTQLCKRQIDGYTFVQLCGDGSQGTVQGDVNIQAVYEAFQPTKPEETENPTEAPVISPETTEPEEPEEATEAPEQTKSEQNAEAQEDQAAKPEQKSEAQENQPAKPQQKPGTSVQQSTKPNADNKAMADDRETSASSDKPTEGAQKPAVGSNQSETVETEPVTESTNSVTETEQAPTASQEQMPQNHEKNEGSHIAVIATVIVLLVCAAAAGIVIL